MGIGPTAISQFTHLFAQNQRDLKAYYRCLEMGHLPTERGLMVRDPDVLERRSLIQSVMCRFKVDVEIARFQEEWEDLQSLAADGLVTLDERQGQGSARVTTEGRWLLRTIAAVFDPQQRQRASGSRLL